MDGLASIRVAPQLRRWTVQQLLGGLSGGRIFFDGKQIVPLVGGGTANTSPIFTLTPNVGNVRVTAANTSSQGGGTVATDIFKALTAGANGSFVTRVRWNPTATTPTTTTATIGRVFYSTVGSGSTTSADTFLLGEVTLPAVSADNATAPTNPIELMVNMAIPTGSFIHVTNHAAPAANTAWIATCIAGDY